MPHIITQQHISKVFKDYRGHTFQALHDINISVERGEFFVLLGPSGCGKSTLLRIMSGLESEFSGEQKYHDGLTTEDLGFVFQQFALLPWLTVRENIALGLIARRPLGKLTNQDNEEIASLIQSLGLEKCAHELPKELSGGMKQRVGIARALVIKPKVMFLDEPFSALDSFTAKSLRAELLNIWKERGVTIVMVTHNIEEALELADRIVVMSAHPGKIENIVENDLPRPRELRSPAFFAMIDKITALIQI
jgi:ABC-type nitrate/sulfonate/bicarbonate transport system ATPase subunit